MPPPKEVNVLFLCSISSSAVLIYDHVYIFLFIVSVSIDYNIYEGKKFRCFITLVSPAEKTLPSVGSVSISETNHIMLICGR